MRDLRADAVHVFQGVTQHRGELAGGELHEAREVDAPLRGRRCSLSSSATALSTSSSGADLMRSLKRVEPYGDGRDRVAEVVQDAGRHVRFAGEERVVDEPMPRLDQVVRHAVELRGQHADLVVALEVEALVQRVVPAHVHGVGGEPADRAQHGDMDERQDRAEDRECDRAQRGERDA